MATRRIIVVISHDLISGILVSNGVYTLVSVILEQVPCRKFLNCPGKDNPGLVVARVPLGCS